MTATARSTFRVRTRTRSGYHGGMLYDVQLQSLDTGNQLWAQTFTDSREAEAFEAQVLADLSELDGAAFRRKYRVPATS